LSDGEFRSGAELAQHFSVSRTTIASWVKDLDAYGLDVYKVRGRGYRLSTELNLITKHGVLEGLSTKVVKTLNVLDVALNTDSTNKSALKSRYTSSDWNVFIAEYQGSGRGRRGKQWVSPLGQNLLFSLGRKRHWKTDVLYSASLMVGLSIAEVLTEFVSSPVKVKWPNDLYIGENKLAGILCELQGSPQDEALLVIGVGLNFGYAPDDLDRETTRLTSHLKNEVSRQEVLIRVLDKIISAFEHEDIDLVTLLAEKWTKYDYLLDRQITIQLGDRVTIGIAKGIDQRGQLIVAKDDGTKDFFNGGEVSVRWS
jgi:BirA family biotin operon repressor/biotin-[acetyl-CoA-carboxylase] ligase